MSVMWNWFGDRCRSIWWSFNCLHCINTCFSFKVTQRSSFRAALKWLNGVFTPWMFMVSVILAHSSYLFTSLRHKNPFSILFGWFALSLWQQSHREYHVFPALNSHVCMAQSCKSSFSSSFPQTSLTY